MPLKSLWNVKNLANKATINSPKRTSSCIQVTLSVRKEVLGLYRTQKSECCTVLTTTLAWVPSMTAAVARLGLFRMPLLEAAVTLTGFGISSCFNLLKPAAIASTAASMAAFPVIYQLKLLATEGRHKCPLHVFSTYRASPLD